MNNRAVPAVFVFLSLGFSLCHAQSIQAESGFNIDVRADLVELFLNVRDRDGMFVGGLQQRHFTVYDDGDARELAFLESEHYPVTVVMLLDTSGSMAKSIFYLQIAASSFLNNLRRHDRVALYSFGGMLKELTPLTKDRSLLIDQIDGIYPQGGTPLYDAVVRGMNRLKKVPGRKALLLFTDGADSTSRLSYESVVRRCGRCSIPVFIVGCGKAIKNRALRKRLDALSNKSGGQSIYVKNTGNLEKAFTQLSDVLRTTYHAGYYSRRKPDGKWHDISVELDRGRCNVRTRNGYYSMK